MTMDKSAIEQLQQSAGAASEAVQKGLPPGIFAVPESINLEKLTLDDIERHQPGRSRFRGIMHTHVVTEFASYVKARAGGEGYIDGDNLKATVFFNLGTKEAPGHGDHRAVLSMKQTAPYAAMCKADGARSDQRGLIDWLEDWTPNLQAIANTPDGGSVIPWAQAVQSIREVTISAKKEVESREGDFNAGRTAMEEIEARSKLGLPSGFLFRCEPYMGLSAREFFLRLSVLTSGDKPVLTLRVVQKEVHQEAIAEEFKALLLNEVGDAAAMTIGAFNP